MAVLQIAADRKLLVDAFAEQWDTVLHLGEAVRQPQAQVALQHAAEAGYQHAAETGYRHGPESGYRHAAEARNQQC